MSMSAKLCWNLLSLVMLAKEKPCAAPAFSGILRHSPARLQPSLLKGPSTGPFSLVPSILPLMKQQSKETSSSPDTREQVYGRT